MTDQKKSAPDTLTETGKNAKIELTEAQLKDVSGGAVDSFLKLDSTMKVQGTNSLKITLADPPGGVR